MKHKPASYTEEEWEAAMRLSKEDFDELMADILDDTGVAFTFRGEM